MKTVKVTIKREQLEKYIGAYAWDKSGHIENASPVIPPEIKVHVPQDQILNWGELIDQFLESNIVKCRHCLNRLDPPMGAKSKRYRIKAMEPLHVGTFGGEDSHYPICQLDVIELEEVE